MKSSRYNIFVQIEDDMKLLYNTLSRKYLVLDSNSQGIVEAILKKPASLEEKNSRSNLENLLISYKMLIADDFDEISYIEFEENKTKFQDQSFHLVIQPTLDCNFRCTYCYEEHKKLIMDDAAAERIIKFIDSITKKVNILSVSWFGGEPLLEIDRIIELTNKFKAICQRNNCKYRAFMTTNGYLLTDSIIDRIHDLNLISLQITLDGCSEYHDMKRPLKNGEGTFHKIMENIVKLSYKDVIINFRVNLDADNYDHIADIFDLIPQENRNKVHIIIANLFQNSKKINVYELYRKAMDKGYTSFNKANAYKQCELCSKNGMLIEPNGRIVPCSPAAEKGLYFGHLDDDGRFILEDSSLYYKLKTISALKSEGCKECVELPMCMGKCKLSRYVNKDVCNSAVPDGLSVEERIKLHYYSDVKLNKGKEVDSV
ncbi:MAG: radical protein [Clostridia bacterium]|jgi:uncharacterized protein|nr:radical protein [Clostridia bacterium]